MIQYRSHLVLVLAAVLGIGLTVTYVSLADSYERERRLHLMDAELSMGFTDVLRSYSTLASTTRVTQRQLEFVLSQAAARGSTGERTEDVRGDIERVLVATLEAVPSIDHIRVMDQHGVETTRINRIDGAARIVMPNALQDKRKRYYVAQGLLLENNDLFFSGRDLNEENDQIDPRRMPTVRAVVRLRGNNPEAAMLVVNFDSQLTLISGDDALRESDLYAVNDKGEFIHGGTRFKDREYAWQVAKDKQNFSDEFPELWPLVAEQYRGSVERPDGLYRWQTTASPDFTAAYAAAGYSDDMPFIALVQFLPKDYLHAGDLLNTNSGRSVLAIIALLLGALLWGLWRMHQALLAAQAASLLADQSRAEEAVARERAEENQRVAEEYAYQAEQHRQSAVQAREQAERSKTKAQEFAQQAEENRQLAESARAQESHARVELEYALAAAESEQRMAMSQRQFAERARERAETAQQQLEQEATRRMRLLSTVSHELRTPAATIQMLLDERDSIGPEQVSELRSLSAHLLRLMDDLKMIGRPTTTRKTDLKDMLPSALLSESRSQSASVLEAAGIEPHLEVAVDCDISLRLDHYRMTTILSNLMRNAALHSGGQHIWVSAKVSPNPPVEPTVSLCIQVEDDGMGIPPSEQSTIFDEFKRGKTNAGGMGLGLTIVREWLESLGGSIHYFDSAHGGAGFEFSVPVVQGKTESVAAPSASFSMDFIDPAVALRNKTILLVEDDAAMRKVQKRLLERLGAKVSTAVNGEEGLEMLRASPVDLVVTDYFMPKLDGVGLMRAMQKWHIDIPVIAVTAATLGLEDEELKQAGARAVISKPMTTESLGRALALSYFNSAKDDH